MNEHSALAQALAVALPAELRPHAADLAVLFDGLADPAEVVGRLTARPVLGAALAALVGQTLDVAGRPLNIDGNVGTLQQITISGGFVERIVGTAITIQLPPAPRVIDPAAAHELLAALPVDAIPPVAPLPELHRMPFACNPLFVGREADLLSLARALKGEGGAAAIGQAAATTGLGGIGKTNLASEFAHRYGQFFAGGVFWLSFADPAGIAAEVAACGAALDLPGFADLKLDEQGQRVQAAWAQPLPRLLVFDNCDDKEPDQAEMLIQQWKPKTGGCRVLITSRRGIWSRSLGIAELPLGVLSRTESIALLRKHRPDLAEDDPILDAIAAELGDLPLALHLAGSFLETYQYEVAPVDYLTQLRSPSILQHPSLQGRGVRISPTAHELHVARTFALSYDKLDPMDPVDVLARLLFAHAAYFAPSQPIPRELLLATLSTPPVVPLPQRFWAWLRKLGWRVPPTAYENMGDPLQHADAVRRLIALGLLEGALDGALRLHRLLGEFVKNMMPDPTPQAAVEETLLTKANQLNKAGDPRPLLVWQLHLRAVTDAAQVRADKRGAGLCSALASHLYMIGAYAEAQPYFEKAQAIDEKVLRAKHPYTAQSMNNMGMLLQTQGAYAEARLYYERALAIQQKVLGVGHPDTATSLNNLGTLLYAQGAYGKARPYLERALAVRQKVLGAEHSDTATSLNNIGMLLQAQGVYAKARLYYEQALTVRQKLFGMEHPATAQSLNNMGLLLQEEGVYGKARPYLEQALAVRQKVLGEEHPDTAQSLDNLGLLLLAQGAYGKAQPYFEQALAIYEKVLGAEHPDTAKSLNNLGGLLYMKGSYAEARLYFEKALTILEAQLGPDHPETQAPKDNLTALDLKLKE